MAIPTRPRKMSLNAIRTVSFFFFFFVFSFPFSPLTVLDVELRRGGSVGERRRPTVVAGVARVQQQLMRRSRMVAGAAAGRGATHVNAVQHRAARRAAQCRSLPHRLFVDLAVHDDHHHARDPEGYERAYYRISQVCLEIAHLRSQKSDGPLKTLCVSNFRDLEDPSLPPHRTP